MDPARSPQSSVYIPAPTTNILPRAPVARKAVPTRKPIGGPSISTPKSTQPIQIEQRKSVSSTINNNPTFPENTSPTTTRSSISSFSTYSLAQPPSQVNLELPTGWTSAFDPEGRIYYINHFTKTCTWARPESNPSPLPLGWEERMTPDGKVYFCNTQTQVTTWERPSVVSTQQAIVPLLNSENGRHIHPEQLISPLPLWWEERTTSDGRIYFCNTQTHITTWERPALISGQQPLVTTVSPNTSRSIEQEQPLSPLSSEWEERTTSDGRLYFCNTRTQVTSWERPLISHQYQASIPASNLDTCRSPESEQPASPLSPGIEWECPQWQAKSTRRRSHFSLSSISSASSNAMSKLKLPSTASSSAVMKGTKNAAELSMKGMKSAGKAIKNNKNVIGVSMKVVNGILRETTGISLGGLEGLLEGDIEIGGDDADGEGSGGADEEETECEESGDGGVEEEEEVQEQPPQQEPVPRAAPSSKPRNSKKKTAPKKERPLKKTKSRGLETEGAPKARAKSKKFEPVTLQSVSKKSPKKTADVVVRELAPVEKRRSRKSSQGLTAGLAAGLIAGAANKELKKGLKGILMDDCSGDSSAGDDESGDEGNEMDDDEESCDDGQLDDDCEIEIEQDEEVVIDDDAIVEDEVIVEDEIVVQEEEQCEIVDQPVSTEDQHCVTEDPPAAHATETDRVEQDAAYIETSEPTCLEEEVFVQEEQTVAEDTVAEEELTMEQQAAYSGAFSGDSFWTQESVLLEENVWSTEDVTVQENVYCQETSTQETAFGQAASEEMVAETSTLEQSTLQETVFEQTTIRETTVDETTIEESTLQETSYQQTTSVQETTVEETVIVDSTAVSLETQQETTFVSVEETAEIQSTEIVTTEYPPGCDAVGPPDGCLDTVILQEPPLQPPPPVEQPSLNETPPGCPPVVEPPPALRQSLVPPPPSEAPPLEPFIFEPILAAPMMVEPPTQSNGVVFAPTYV